MRSPIALATVLLGLSAVQAQEEKREVSGTVRLNGKPVPLARITFLGKGNRGSVSVFVEDGKYVCVNPPEGGAIRVVVDTGIFAFQAQQANQRIQLLTRRVQIQKELKQEDPEVARQIDELKARLKQLEAAAKKAGGMKIPPQYANPDETPLKVEIKAGKQTLDLELKTDQ